MIASVFWKRIICWRAFSSDMWLTPKNWLSPKSSRSISGAPFPEPAALLRRGRSRAPGGGADGGAGLGVLDDHGHRAVGLGGRSEVVLHRASIILRNRGDEVVELGGIFLAPEVKPTVLGELGGVFHCPSTPV